MASFCFIPLEKVPGHSIPLLPKTQHRQESLDVLLPLGLRAAVQLAVKVQVVVGAQVVVEAHVVRHQADELPYLQSVLAPPRVVVADPGFAARLRDEAAEHPYGRRLPCPVGPQETEDLPSVDFESQVVNGCEATEPLRETFQFQSSGGITDGKCPALFTRARALYRLAIHEHGEFSPKGPARHSEVDFDFVDL